MVALSSGAVGPCPELPDLPASAVPLGYEHLVRPVFPAVTQPVIAVVRHGAGPAEMALLELLREQTWSEPVSLAPVT